MYVNVGQMISIIDGEPLEEVDCCKHLRSQVIEREDVKGCGTQNESGVRGVGSNKVRTDY